ncbi:MAG: hypothetical protein QXJ28_02445 [Candidatus Pacearchaeota archaeon]
MYLSLSNITKIDKWDKSKIILDPRNLSIDWCKSELSPCSIIYGNNSFSSTHYLIILNGRSLSCGDSYGKYSVGLGLFDFKSKRIKIYPEPLIKENHEIIFASDFLKIDDNYGLLYCHINDSFVKTYKLNLKELLKLL